ncbi:hypothetical protein QJS04_geneDACA022802 [Acorus gramineus]|uniref:Uncharacterized protein n=1 Tax=Acorus gramineus TaxID=55184 RepID=A0AAV9B2C3_ACOGR|nr:hypothetical protein QJS04_geneDACA022802 [Acorus gramineus]
MVGSLGDLYGSFESLSDTHIQLGQNKASSSTQPNSTLHSQVGSFPSAPKNWYNCGCNRYMVMDNLAVMPMSIISCLSLFKKFNIKEVGSLQERVVELGMDEVTFHTHTHTQ